MSGKAIVVPKVTVGPTEALRVVLPPAGLVKEERVAALAGLVSTLRAPFAGQLNTVEVVYNILQLGVPEIRTATPTFQSIVVQNVSPTKDEYLYWTGVVRDQGEKINPDLPVLPGPVVQDAFSVTNEVTVYIALASLLFSIGKQATESARASVMDNRPDALIRRFSLSEAEQIILPGREAGPSRESLESIYNAFANYTEIRKAIIVLFLGLKQAGDHLPIHLEVLMTNFNLLRGTGMTHVDAIIKLVRMQPWVLAVPKLEPFFHRFTEELVKFEKVELSVRPYHRLLVPQGDYLFLSSELRPLIAVAGSFIEEVEKTFGNYVYNKATYQDLIDEVRSYAPGYTPTSQLSQLAGLLGVKEAPLPPRAQVPATQPSATV